MGMNESEVIMKPERQFFSAFLILVIVGTLAAPAAMARTRVESLPELAARSQWVGIARCVEAASHRDGTKGMIFTVYRFERLDTVAGQTPDSFTLRIAGGTSGPTRGGTACWWPAPPAACCRLHGMRPAVGKWQSPSGRARSPRPRRPHRHPTDGTGSAWTF